MREQRTEVLVVGAGPAGLWIALQMARSGLEVAIIDRESTTTARSYACALHPATLELFREAGILEPLLRAGRRIPKVGFYEGAERKAELDISKVNASFPFLLILPQREVEELLETKLKESGVKVQWNHRFDGYDAQQEQVEVTVEELGGTSTGYVVPHWEETVRNRTSITADCLVGADGNHSLVRQRAGVESQRFGQRQFFAAYEFQSDTSGEDEIKVVLTDESTSVLWPLPDSRFRWTFQLLQPQPGTEFPLKERRAVHQTNKNIDEQIREHVEKLAGKRAPWFRAGIKEVDWCTQVVFENRLAETVSKGRCWLAGDAAHQTGPVGVQSMNAAFAEGIEFVRRLKPLLRENESETVIQKVSAAQRDAWLRILGKGARPNTNASKWVQGKAGQLTSCLPGFGSDLDKLANQLGLEIG